MASAIEISRSLYGDFRPTGVYTFELRVKHHTIYEIPLLLPPQSLSANEGWLVDASETLSGGMITDHGNKFKSFTLSGECWFYYAGNPAAPLGGDDNLLSADSALDGYSEFLKLRFILSRYRDYHRLDPERKVRGHNFSQRELVVVQAFRAELDALTGGGGGALSNNVQLLVHAYDFDDHWAVIVNDFDWRIAKADPFSVYFDVKMTAYEIDPLRSGLLIPGINVGLVRDSYGEQIQNSNNRLQSSSLATVPDSIDVSAATGAVAIASTAQIGNRTISVADESEQIPIQLQGSTNLLILNEQIRGLRAELSAAVSNINSGTVPASDAFVDIITQLKTSINSAKNEIVNYVVLAQDFGDFESGELPWTDYATLETMTYYNEFLKMELYADGFDVALIELDGSQDMGITPSVPGMQQFAESIDTDEFEDPGYLAPTVSLQQGYSYHQVSEGETLQDIALSLLGDPGLYREIARVNEITDSQLLDGSLVGALIKVPLPEPSPARSPENLVYEKLLGTSDQLINRFIHGRDLLIASKKFKVTPGGRLARIEGPQNTVQSVLRRNRVPKGSLGPNRPNFGVLTIGDIMNHLPLEVAVEKLITDYESQCRADPRIRSASTDLGNLIIDGDAIYYQIDLEFTNGTRDTIKANQEVF